MQSNGNIRRSIILCAVCALCSFFLASSAGAQLFPKKRDTGPKPKNIHGIVQDLQNKPVVGARVFLKNMQTSVVRTLETDQNGEYKVFGLNAVVDYELYAEFKGKSSEKKFVSSYLNREDNVLNFQLDVAGSASTSAPSTAAGPTFKSYDLVELHASLDLPVGVPAPMPAILLLHGYGEDRTAWKDFSKQLLNRGFAVMAMDLRGHERDISHSSVERIIFPDSTILADYLLDRTATLIEKLVVYPDRMRQNLELTHGLIYSGELLLALVAKNVSREQAYQWVQRNAMRVWDEGGTFREKVASDADVNRVLTDKDVERVFDSGRLLGNVDRIFNRVFKG